MTFFRNGQDNWTKDQQDKGRLEQHYKPARHAYVEYATQQQHNHILQGRPHVSLQNESQ